MPRTPRRENLTTSTRPGLPAGAACSRRVSLAPPQYAVSCENCQLGLQFANMSLYGSRQLSARDERSERSGNSTRSARSVSDPPCAGPGSAINADSTWPWRMRGSTSAGFPTVGCCACVRIRQGQPFRISGGKLGITRQGAGKVVSHLEDRGYVFVADSPRSGREKAVTLTVLGKKYLTAQRRAVRTIERQLRADLSTTQHGDEALDILYQLLDVLDEGDGIRMRTYLRNTTVDLDAPHGAPKRRHRNR